MFTYTKAYNRILADIEAGKLPHYAWRPVRVEVLTKTDGWQDGYLRHKSVYDANNKETEYSYYIRGSNPNDKIFGYRTFATVNSDTVLTSEATNPEGIYSSTCIKHFGSTK